MADYSFVRGPDGQVVELWIRDNDLAQTPAYVVTLLKKHQGGLAQVRKPISNEVLTLALSHNYRIVPNKVDRQGDCFVMFGNSRAPGEEA